MDSGSLCELKQHFEERLQLASKVVPLRDAMVASDSLYLAHCHSLKAEMDGLEATVRLMREELSKQQQSLKLTQELTTAVATFAGRVQYVEDNFPRHLPHMQKQNVNQNSCESRQTSGQSSEREGTSSAASGKSISKESAGSSNGTPTPPPTCPTIDYLTSEEFDNVPKYMKGRMPYEQVNKAIDEMNKSFQAKYSILTTKKSKKNDLTRKRIASYKQQETKDTKGVYFVVEADLTEFSSIRMDRSMHAILTMLRHCCRIREIRGCRLVRYAIIEAY